MSFIQKLASVNPQANFLHTSLASYAQEDIIKQATALREGVFSSLKNQSVSLLCHNPSSFILGLIALDGWASSILLLPSSSQPALQESLEQRAHSSLRIVSQQSPEDFSLIPLPHAASNPPKAHTAWIIPTSGTTGTPKLLAHTLQSLTTSLRPPRPHAPKLSWGLLYDPTRFAGIQVILFSLLSGNSLIAPDDWRDLPATIALFSQKSCNALSATPSFWKKLAIAGLLNQMDLRVVTLGGERADQSILDTLAATFPQAILRHIYASTEAGVGFSVSDGKEGFPQSYLTHPPQGVRLAIREDGMLLLAPQNVQQELLDSSKTLLDKDGWIESGDLLEARGDRYIFLGRLNGAINVGGQKVHPSQVEELIQRIDGVLASYVYGVANSILGQLPAADIVLAKGASRDLVFAEITDFLKEHLPRYARPTRLTEVATIPLSDSGKIQRKSQ